MKFDAYIASDFMWAVAAAGHASRAGIPRRRRQVRLRRAGRLDVAHGTASSSSTGGSGQLRRRRSHRRRQSGDPADRHAENRLPRRWQFNQREVLAGLGLVPVRPTVLYAPTWSPDFVAERDGPGSVGRLAATCRSTSSSSCMIARATRGLDTRVVWTGIAALQPLLAAGRAVLAPGHDISAVPGCRRPDDHGPQLGRVRVSSCAIGQSCASTVRRS